MMGGLNPSWADSLGMLVWMLLLWGGLAWLCVSLFGHSHAQRPDPTLTRQALLDDRYARGELDEITWRTQRALLGAETNSPNDPSAH